MDVSVIWTNRPTSCTKKHFIYYSIGVIVTGLIIAIPILATSIHASNSQEGTTTALKGNSTLVGNWSAHLKTKPTKPTLEFDLKDKLQDGGDYSIHIQVKFNERLCTTPPKQGTVYTCFWKDGQIIKWSMEPFKHKEGYTWIKYAIIGIKDLSVSKSNMLKVTTNHWDCVDINKTVTYLNVSKIRDE